MSDPHTISKYIEIANLELGTSAKPSTVALLMILRRIHANLRSILGAIFSAIRLGMVDRARHYAVGLWLC